MTCNLTGKIIRSIGRIIFLFLTVTSGKVFSQQYYFDNYSVSQGLAQSTVYSIIQDRNDNYWMGTQAGLSKFDGVSFVNYTAEDGIAEGGVRTVFEDSFGNLWIGHDGGGITRFDGNSFEVYDQTALHLKSNITTILEDAEGHLWIASQESGAALIKNPGAPLDSVRYEMYLGRRLSDRIFGGMLSEDGSLYFVTDPVVKKFNRDSLRFDQLEVNGVPRFFATTCILEDRNRNLWFGTYHGGLFRYMPEADDSKMYDLIKLGMTSNWISTLFEDRYGNLWIGTWGGGVGRLDPDDGFTVFDGRNGMPGSKIWRIIEDKEGNIVFGTNEHGICAFKGDYFVSWFEGDGLINSQVFAVDQVAEGSFWVGTNKGISIIDTREKGSTVRDFYKLKGERVRFIEEDKTGNKWIGADGQGLFTYTSGSEFRFDPLINSNIPHGMVTGLEVDHLNNLWVGTLDGLIYYEINNRKISRLTQMNGLEGNEISAVFPDSKGRIWIGIRGKGVNIIEGSDFKKANLELNITPTCFTEDRNGVIWIGTEGRGVLGYSMEEDLVVKHLTVRDNGLLANLINLLNCDENNFIYIGTNKGLNKYDQQEGKIYGFTRKSGFVGIETKPNATCLDNDGNLWFGTVLGVTRYNPALKPRDVIEPLTHITGLMVNYKPYPFFEGMNLSYRHNSLIFDYRCITLNPEAVQYQIMLDGIDIDWRPPDTYTQVNYPALPPKRYTFYVKAKNSDGVWNDPPISLSFQIRPPFYMTWWFILSCIVALGTIIIAYIKMRERALLRENRILEDKVRARTQQVVAQKEELAQKNKDITDSIRYAKRIQFAILPPKSPFPETFILFKPKDIVSGDFYWFTEVEGREFIAAVDCTGHGVPGAFMSIIGHNSLNKIVNQYGILEPGMILNELNREVVETLHHTSDDGDVTDGMDLSLITFDRNNMVIKFAGAYNSMYLVRDGELLEVKADRQPIGLGGPEKKEFKTEIVEVRKGDMVYLFSDGYADQFGGEKLKKFKSTNMKDLLVKISGEKVEKQRDILDDSIEKWRGNIEQVDDILVIGRRF
jgi:ligand-binding sensor domain-containing protein/serine phosphatase RsbU (regulator of sigma subunit)